MTTIGIYNLHMEAMGGGEKLTLALAEHLSLKHNVLLFSDQDLDVPSLEKFFGVDLSRIVVKRLDSPDSLIANVLGRNRRTHTPHHFLQLKDLNLDLFINSSYGSRLECPAERGIFLCMFPHQNAQEIEPVARRIKTVTVNWIGKHLDGSADGNTLDSYPIVIAISRYSAEWVRRLWGRNSELVYPPCDDMGPPATKRNMILHVGRFIAEGTDGRHTKNQKFLIETFKRLTDLHDAGWELRFAGSVSTGADSTDLVKTLKEGSHGFPITFHFNAPRSQLRQLYQTAAIYWHATGYGFDEDQHPGKQEHFGITTVEAMSAGVVPIVYGSGGQKEIVTEGVNGFLWSDVDQLTRRTREVATDQMLSGGLSTRAMESSKQFGRRAFTARLDELITASMCGTT